MTSEYNWNLVVKDVNDFDLKQIFDCGQCFRWEPHPQDENIWQGLAQDRAAAMKYDKDNRVLHIADFGGAGEAFWRDYLDLDRDYGAIKSMLADGDEAMAKAISCGSGIRILKQEPWEALVSFIISQNNNIPRIKKCINSLAMELGKPVEHELEGVGKLYSLPDAETLANATLDDLAPCRLGYRAKYLMEAGRQISENTRVCEAAGLDCSQNFLEQLRDSQVAGGFATAALQEICGVGPKVANCIGLFGLNKLDSFPIDVWMKRVMNRVYGIPENDVKSMKRYADENFGQYGGIAQQYLFNYIART